MLFEYSSKFTLVQIAHLFCNLRYRLCSGYKKNCSFFHSKVFQIYGESLAVYDSEVVFQAGSAYTESIRWFPGRMMLAQIGSDDLFGTFCSSHLCLCEKCTYAR